MALRIFFSNIGNSPFILILLSIVFSVALLAKMDIINIKIVKLNNCLLLLKTSLHLKASLATSLGKSLCRKIVKHS